VKLNVISFHSVAGGCGRTTLGRLAAQGLASCRPPCPTVFIDFDLPGVGHAGGLLTLAPFWRNDVPDDELIFTEPVGFGEAPAGYRNRDFFIDDYLLQTRPHAVRSDDAHPAAFLRRDVDPQRTGWFVCASGVPERIERLELLLDHEVDSGFVQGRLELFLDAVVGWFRGEGAEQLNVVIDTPPRLCRSSMSVSSLALRLPAHEPIVEGEFLPPELDDAEISWELVVVTSPDVHTIRATARALSNVESAAGTDVKLLINELHPADLAPLLMQMGAGDALPDNAAVQTAREVLRAVTSLSIAGPDTALGMLKGIGVTCIPHLDLRGLTPRRVLKALDLLRPQEPDVEVYRAQRAHLLALIAQQDAIEVRADELRDRMDGVWRRLSAEDIEALEADGTPEEEEA